MATLNSSLGSEAAFTMIASPLQMKLFKMLARNLESGQVEWKSDDVVINTGTMPLHRRHRTNMLKVTVVD